MRLWREVGVCVLVDVDICPALGRGQVGRLSCVVVDVGVCVV